MYNRQILGCNFTIHKRNTNGQFIKFKLFVHPQTPKEKQDAILQYIKVANHEREAMMKFIFLNSCHISSEHLWASAMQKTQLWSRVRAWG